MEEEKHWKITLAAIYVYNNCWYFFQENVYKFLGFIVACVMTFVWLYVTAVVGQLMLWRTDVGISSNNVFLIYIFAGFITLTVGLVWYSIYCTVAHKE